MDSYRILELNIIRWAEARKIIPNSTPQAQFIKMVSEVGELADAEGKNNLELIKDSIGDIMVCLINYCALRDLDLVDCLSGAYDEIKNRKGSMNEKGVFIKE